MYEGRHLKFVGLCGVGEEETQAQRARARRDNRNSWVMSGRFSKTQMMRASAFNYAALNKHA